MSLDFRWFTRIFILYDFNYTNFIKNHAFQTFFSENQQKFDEKMEYEIDAISCGALLSDYQRVRVENICSRLGLVNFAPLWQKDQSQYLEDLEAVGINSVIVKERFSHF